MTTNDNLKHLYVAIANGLNRAGRGRKDQEIGRGEAAANLVALATALHNDEDEYRNIIRHCACIHSNAKERPEAFAASWAFWRDALGVTLDKVSSKDEKDAMTRDGENTPITGRIAALRFAASVVYAMDSVSVVWANVSATPKSKDAFAVDAANALRLFPEREKAIESSDINTFIIASGRGNYRMNALESLGNKAMVRDGVRKPVKAQANVPHVPVVDQAKTVNEAIEDADSRAIDRPADQNEVLRLMLTCVNALNDSTLKGFRFTNDEVQTITAVVENARQRAVKIAKAA